MKIIKEFKDLPEDWKEQLFTKAQGTVLPKRHVGNKNGEHRYPTPPSSMHLHLFIDETTHKKFLDEVPEYKEAWDFAIELCRAEWLQQATRIMNDRNVNYSAVFELYNQCFGETFKTQHGKQKQPLTTIKEKSKPQYSDDDLDKLTQGKENSSGNADSK